MSRLTFRQIEAFRAVMLSGSISGGANLIGLTQPAVSRLVRDLELHLRFDLFSRKGNSILPTPEAHLFAQEVDAQFRWLDKIEQSARFIRNAKKGAVRIISMTGAATRFMPNIVDQYLNNFPLASISLQNSTSSGILEGVASRRYDLGFGHAPPEYPGIEVETLKGPGSLAVVPANHELARCPIITLEDLAEVPLLALTPSSPVWGQFAGALESRRVKPRIVFEAGASESLCSLAALGKGVGIIDPFTSFGITDPRIVIKPFYPKLEYTVSLIFQKGERKSRAVTEFAKLIRAGVSQLCEEVSQL